MKLETRAAERRDLPELKRMIDEYLAVDYYSLEELEACIQGDRNLFYVVTDAEKGDGIVSFYYAALTPLDEALEILHVRQTPEALRGYSPDTPVGIYKTASTATDYRKHGICTSFVRDLEPVMRQRGAKMIVATAWRTPDDSIPMKKIFHDAGFEPIAEIRRPWESLTLYCVYCKRTHCICDAVFYMKKLDETKDGDLNEQG